MAKNLWFGFARTDITCFEPGISMWGWGATGNVAVGAATPLYARALVLAQGRNDPPWVLATLELGMISESLRREVLSSLRAAGLDLDEHRLTLTATHTHSGPAGFSSYLFYAMAGPGFHRSVHDHIVKGTVAAVLAAARALTKGTLHVAHDELPLSDNVSFNRSLDAYNRNHDVNPLPPERANEAVDRRMTVLRFTDTAGRARGLLSFFAVHGTSIHSDSDHLHSDNKGVAARICEQQHGDGFVAMFAQAAAGDVTPNHRFDRRRGLLVGPHDDDRENAEHNGAIQARHALRLFASETARAVAGRIDARLRYTEFDHAEVDPDLAGGWPNARTGTPCLGFGFSLGTLEGPGPLGWARGAVDATHKLWAVASARAAGAFKAAHGRKIPFWDFGERDNRILGFIDARRPVNLPIPDRRWRFYRSSLGTRGVRVLSWVPCSLPVQIVRLGDLALAFLSFEPTTQCGRRLAALVRAELNVSEVIVAGYANAYASYLTTPEEYDQQAYEGASTLFGRWSHGAAGTALRRVARSFAAEAGADVGPRPPHVALEDLPTWSRERSRA